MSFKVGDKVRLTGSKWGRPGQRGTPGRGDVRVINHIQADGTAAMLSRSGRSCWPVFDVSDMEAGSATERSEWGALLVHDGAVEVAESGAAAEPSDARLYGTRRISPDSASTAESTPDDTREALETAWAEGYAAAKDGRTESVNPHIKRRRFQVDMHAYVDAVDGFDAMRIADEALRDVGLELYIDDAEESEVTYL